MSEGDIKKLLADLEASSNSKFNIHSFINSQRSSIEELKDKANSGDTLSQLRLALVYHRGHGTHIDNSQSKHWFILAATNDNVTAKGYCAYNGFGRTESKEEAFKFFQLASNTGDGNAINMIGQCLMNGSGTKKDTKEALICFFKSATTGCISGINNLGICYEYGYGVSINVETAFKFYKVAANLGALVAIHNVGWFYQYGKSVPLDIESALFWMKCAADCNHNEARSAVRRLTTFNPQLKWKNEWHKIRLLWIGNLKNDSECFFSVTPKEIIKEISRLLVIVEFEFY